MSMYWSEVLIETLAEKSNPSHPYFKIPNHLVLVHWTCKSLVSVSGKCIGGKIVNAGILVVVCLRNMKYMQLSNVG